MESLTSTTCTWSEKCTAFFRIICGINLIWASVYTAFNGWSYPQSHPQQLWKQTKASTWWKTELWEICQTWSAKEEIWWDYTWNSNIYFSEESSMFSDLDIMTYNLFCCHTNVITARCQRKETPHAVLHLHVNQFIFFQSKKIMEFVSFLCGVCVPLSLQWFFPFSHRQTSLGLQIDYRFKSEHR